MPGDTREAFCVSVRQAGRVSALDATAHTPAPPPFARVRGSQTSSRPCPRGWASAVLGTEPAQCPARASHCGPHGPGPGGRVLALSATRPASSRAPCLENTRTATHRVCASPSPTSCRASWGPAGWSPPPLPALPFPRARGTEGHRPIFIARWRFCGKPDDICSAVHCLFTLHVREQEAAGPPLPGSRAGRRPASARGGPWAAGQ